MNSNQLSIVEFFDPAFKQSTSILQNTAEFIEFCINCLEVEYQGWKLPAISEPHDWCGLWKIIGCNRTNLHERLGKGRLTYTKQFRRSCYRTKYKFCYLNWIARQANVATRQIETFSKKSKQKLNLDGNIHRCSSINSPNIISNQIDNMPLKHIVEGHTKLITKLIRRIEILEKRRGKE